MSVQIGSAEIVQDAEYATHRTKASRHHREQEVEEPIRIKINSE